jgi:hypothetical protein
MHERREGRANLMKRVQAFKGNLHQSEKSFRHNSNSLRIETLSFRALRARAPIRMIDDSEGICRLRMGHLFRPHQFVEFLLSEVAQFQSGLTQAQMFMMGLVRDLRRLVVSNLRAQSRHQHERIL